MISVRDLTSGGLALSLVRRIGGVLFSNDCDWWTVNRSSEISAGAALSILIVEHLAHDKKVLDESCVLSALGFFRDNVARYATMSQAAIEKANSVGDAADRRLPVIMLEVMEGRWVCFGDLAHVFDTVEQCSVLSDDVSKGLDATGTVVKYSHSLCLLPLFLQACPLERLNADDAEPENSGNEAQ